MNKRPSVLRGKKMCPIGLNARFMVTDGNGHNECGDIHATAGRESYRRCCPDAMRLYRGPRTLFRANQITSGTEEANAAHDLGSDSARIEHDQTAIGASRQTRMLKQA